MKRHTSMRLTAEAKKLLRKLAKKLGISQTAVVEIAVRKLNNERDNKAA